MKTQAERDADHYKIFGQKIWISSAEVASNMILLARPTRPGDVRKSSEALSLFFIDFDKNYARLEGEENQETGL